MRLLLLFLFASLVSFLFILLVHPSLWAKIMIQLSSHMMAQLELSGGLVLGDLLAQREREGDSEATSSW